MDGQELLTVSQAAQELGINVATVRDRLVSGHMHGVKAGPRAWLIPRAEVDRWKERGRLKPGPKPQPPSSRDAQGSGGAP